MNQLDRPYYVGIGASAGGLEALEGFFKAMPVDTGMVFIVIQHLSPDYKSLMNELLARYTKMEIHIAEDGMETLPNHIYLIPPKYNLTIYHGKLYLEEQNNHNRLNLPIDIFFKSLAQDQGKHAVGVILSGTGSDGTLGVRALKEQGGMIMVQEESSAKFDGMPSSSISTGLVDYICNVEQMAEELMNFIEHPLEKDTELIIKKVNREMDHLSRIYMLLRESSGVDFTYYKENTVLRRIERRIKINRLTTIEEYVVFLASSNKEKETLYRELLIGVTNFFRDQEAFRALVDKVFPRLSLENNSIRIWSAACSTGEEVYSLAILIAEFIEQNNLNVDVKIFATDIDRNALDIAGKGFYPDSILADVDIDLLAKYFIRKENGYEIRESIRNMIVFARHNILKDPPFSKLDLLVCRNLFIYFKPEMQQKVLGMFYYSLAPHGFLMMGSSESIGEMNDAFEVIDSKWKIFRYKSGYNAHLSNNLTSISPRYAMDHSHTISESILSRNAKSEHLLMNALSTLLPAAVILDERNNIMQVINDMSKYLKIKPGKFTSDIFSNLPSDLALFVNSIMRRLKAGEVSIITESVKGIEERMDLVVKITGRTIDYGSQNAYLLSFEEEVNEVFTQSPTASNLVFDYEASERIRQLELDLQISKESLQATVEELETSNEELQSSNEELIASNEELQSTNEELQSVNEELYTVNSEYQYKIEELVNLNNDLNNLIKNTDVGALYLDRKLCIRKITPIVSKITNILPTDLGRPIAHIAAVKGYEEMISDVDLVVENLQPIDRELIDHLGKTWLVRIRPYRTEYNAVEGIIITFVDISSLKNEKERLFETNRRLEAAMQYGNMAWWEWDVKTGVVIFNEKKATMLGYTVEEFPSNVYEICNLIHPEDYDETMKCMEDHMYGRTPLWEVTYRIKRKDGTYAWYYDRGSVIKRGLGGEPLYLIGTVIDVSRIKTLEKEIQGMGVSNHE